MILATVLPASRLHAVQREVPRLLPRRTPTRNDR